MKLLFTGKGTSGSWVVRGEQLGKACGATVKPRASLADCKQADLIVLVKRPTPELIATIKKSKKPWVWDVVDFYPQPACTNWGASQAIHWVKSQVAQYLPNGIIWPNARMGDDCATSTLSTVIYHHHRPGIKKNPIRGEVKRVGYEGSEKYLGKWRDTLLKECKARGWELRINHGPHADIDICVAFRDTPFNGYVQYHWKSNVKLSNCHGSGTPFIGPAECGYVETSAGGEVWVENPKHLSDAFDRLAPQDIRQDISRGFLGNAISLEDAAQQLRAFVARV